MGTLKLIIAAPAESIESAALTGQTVAHMIYRIGRGYRLFRAQGASVVRGGLMVVDTTKYTGGGPSSSLVTEIVTECRKSGFTGIVLDTGGASSRALMSLTGHLGAEAAEYGLSLYVPAKLADASEHAVALIPTALSGGTLREHLQDAIRRHGVGHVALEMERVRMDFALPARNGTGRELSAGELDALIGRVQPQSFLSKDLCAYYFNYRDKDGTHFVLYDTAASFKRKMSVAAQFNIADAFVYYPHVADIIDDILT